MSGFVPRTSSRTFASAFVASPPGSQSGGHAGAHPKEFGYSHVVTTSSEASVMRAWFAAHFSASIEDSEPSTPTTISALIGSRGLFVRQAALEPRRRSAGPLGPRRSKCAPPRLELRRRRQESPRRWLARRSEHPKNLVRPRYGPG